jgi:hypothetical protein
MVGSRLLLSIASLAGYDAPFTDRGGLGRGGLPGDKRSFLLI